MRSSGRRRHKYLSVESRIDGGTLMEPPDCYYGIDVEEMHAQKPYLLMMEEIERVRIKKRYRFIAVEFNVV